MTPFDKLCADALADEVAVLVRRKVIDSRSPAADALLDYRNPPSSPRADRLAELEEQVKTAKAMGAYEAGRDHAPAIVQLVETNTRLSSEMERLKSQLKESHRRHTEAEALLADANDGNTRLVEALRVAAVEFMRAAKALDDAAGIARVLRKRHPQDWGSEDEDFATAAKLARAASRKASSAVDGTASDNRAIRQPIPGLYPPGWPKCACGDYVLDGKATCGRIECHR